MKKAANGKIRFDSKHIRLRVGESEKPGGGYEYRWTTPDGKRHSIFSSTLDALRDIEEQLVVDKHDGIRTDVKMLTVNDCFELWKDLKRGIKDTTMKNYIWNYKTYVQGTFGKKRVVQVVKTDVKRFYNNLHDQRNLKVSTIDTIHNVLHQVFQVAVDDNYIRQNPTDNMLKELRIAHGDEIEKRRALTMEQQELFLGFLEHHAKYSHWHPIFYIMLNTGMRVGELTGLRWQDIDLERDIISVNHTLVYYDHQNKDKCCYSINTPKTEAGKRELPITAGIREALEALRSYQEEAGLQSKTRVDGYEDFVFLNRNGAVLNQSTLNSAIKRIMRDCNDEVLSREGFDADPVLLPNFTCHILRHTYATRLCESGINIKVIQDLMGHRDIETTMNIYVDVTNDLKKREMEEFEKYMATKQPKRTLRVIAGGQSA